MKAKLFKGLKQEYSNLGLSDEIIQGHADALAEAGFVTDENLATVIQGQKGVLTSLQSTIDRRVTDAMSRVKPNPTPQPTPTPTGLTAEDVNKMVSTALQAHKNEQTKDAEAKAATEKRNSDILIVAKKYGVPDFMMKDRAVPAEANLDDYFKGVAQEVSDAGFALASPPQLGSKPKDEASEIANLINKGTEELSKK
ncbi:MAG: hypothetical protein R3Y50_05990 [Rikenellaceae bacterium]